MTIQMKMMNQNNKLSEDPNQIYKTNQQIDAPIDPTPSICKFVPRYEPLPS